MMEVSWETVTFDFQVLFNCLPSPSTMQRLFLVCEVSHLRGCEVCCSRNTVAVDKDMKLTRLLWKLYLVFELLALGQKYEEVKCRSVGVLRKIPYWALTLIYTQEVLQMQTEVSRRFLFRSGKAILEIKRPKWGQFISLWTALILLDSPY